ncbi:unnamed protein product [Durusdinium trenchii]|uniref:AsmA-like C-terminal domain-containing protein n=1 Tax=Durusdinium trenchii TaxID=1381693 RepID=A0ABP0QH49_9DINO
MRRQFTIGANVDREGRLCGDVKVVQPGLLGSPVDATASMTTTPSSAREFALRLTSPVSAVLSAFAGPFGGAVLAGPFSRRSALPGDGQVDLQFSRKTREEAACGYSSICTQGLLQLSGQSLTQMSTWRLDADWSLRDLDISGGPGRYPSMQLQMEKLRSLKTSLKYSATHLAELFDAGLLNAKAALELAGPPGDVSFLRGELVVKAGMLLGSTTLGPLNGHVSMGCGLLLPAGRSCPQVQGVMGEHGERVGDRWTDGLLLCCDLCRKGSLPPGRRLRPLGPEGLRGARRRAAQRALRPEERRAEGPPVRAHRRPRRRSRGLALRRGVDSYDVSLHRRNPTHGLRQRWPPAALLAFTRRSSSSLRGFGRGVSPGPWEFGVDLRAATAPESQRCAAEMAVGPEASFG